MKEQEIEPARETKEKRVKNRGKTKIKHGRDEVKRRKKRLKYGHSGDQEWVREEGEGGRETSHDGDKE